MYNVSWEDAIKYITWLSEKTGKPYRLLTEAEWEYAARAGTTTPYAFGNTITERQAKFSDGTWPGLYANLSVEVGSFPPNAWGLYDMHGNVWEWCSDTRDYSAGGPFYRVLRGGAWNSLPHDLRSARRLWTHYYSNGRDIGFRVARTL
jgi:formylglycine-generating enzyme required for sulfatase activity